MASLYWVGGTGNWSDATNHWATTSGGAPGAGNLPTTTDDVIFDTLSNATAYTVTVNTTADCANFTMGGPLVGKVTWAGTSALNIYGSMNLSGGTAGITRTYSATTLTFKSTSTGNTITTNGIDVGVNVTFDGSGGGWTMQDAFTITNPITVTNGTLDTNGVTVSMSQLVSNNSNVRTITLGASTLNITGALNFATTTNLTFNCNTSIIKLTTTATFTGGGQTFNEVQLNGTSHTVNSVNTFATLTRTGTATKTDNLTFGGNQTITGTLTINGNSTTNRLIINSSVKGTQRTITAATVTVTNSDFADILGAGAGSWNLSAITGLSGDCGGNSGITFTTPATQYAKTGASANWSGAIWFTTSGGATPGRVPLPQDTAIFDANSITAGSIVITQDMPRIPGTNWTGVTNTPTWTTSTVASVFGSLTLVSGMTLTASTQTYTFEGRGSYTITNATKAWNKPIIFSCPTGTYTLQDSFDAGTGNNITTTSGTLDTNSQTVTCSNFQSTGSLTRGVTLGSSLMLCGWNFVASGLTFNAGTSTIKITIPSVNFLGGGLTYNNFWFARGGSAGNLTVSGSNTFNDFKDDGTIAHSILFTAGTTQTVNTFTVNGTAGQLITINSNTTATHNLVKAGGGTISCDYLNIQHSVATPSNTWYAGTNSTDNQAVATAGSGWYFGAFPSSAIKTVDGLAYASVKSVKGLAVASIKNINGLA